MTRYLIEPYYQLKPRIKSDRNILLLTAQNIINNIKTLNPQLNAYVNVYEDEVLETVKNCDINKKLAGMMIGIKDLICYAEHPIEASSNILKGFHSHINATLVQRIIDNGGIIVGHQNCDQFGMGSSNENSCHGPARNFLDINKTPGGSSGGSAVAVQSDMCHVAIGTDTGGSVRQPAAFCGIIGLKPTYGRISRYGVIAYSSSFDTVGLFGKRIEDIALVLENISGKDEKDCTSSSRVVEKYFDNLDNADFSKTKVAYLGESLELPGLQKEIGDALRSLIKILQEDDIDVEKRKFEYLDLLVPVYYVITAAEASSNLARYDGIRYGRCTEKNVDNLEEFVMRTRGEGFGMEVKKRILFGNQVLMSPEILEQAQKVRRIIYDDTKKIFEDYEFIILPTAPTTAFNLDRKNVDPQETYLADIFTNLASISGLPAISIPFGYDDKGLPIGLQIIANHFDEQRLMAFAKKILSKVNF